MSYSRMPVLVVVLISCGLACGDDDTDRGADDAPVFDAGARDGGIGPSRPGDEGWLCAEQKECGAAFKCVGTFLAVNDNGTTRNIGVCARSCSTTAGCEANEICHSYTDKAADLHCINLVTEEYAACGVADTSICEGRTCLYDPSLPFGVCADICSLDGSSGDAGVDAGVVDDGGVVLGAEGTTTCRAEETCIDGILASPKPGEGVCGLEVDRGQPCSVVSNGYCKTGDVCAPEDPSHPDASDWRCFQDCSSGDGCDTGSCQMIGTLIAYCR